MALRRMLFGIGPFCYATSVVLPGTPARKAGARWLERRGFSPAETANGGEIL